MDQLVGISIRKSRQKHQLFLPIRYSFNSDERLIKSSHIFLMHCCVIAELLSHIYRYISKPVYISDDTIKSVSLCTINSFYLSIHLLFQFCFQSVKTFTLVASTGQSAYMASKQDALPVCEWLFDRAGRPLQLQMNCNSIDPHKYATIIHSGLRAPTSTKDF